MGDGSYSIETAPHNDAIVRATFAPCGFRHRIDLLRAGEVVTCLTEIESADATPWPPSPPWQELHIPDKAGGKVLMLVGRAGSSHWSMAVGTDDSQQAIIFDIACRVRQQPDFLGTTYRHSGDQPRELEIQSLAADAGPKSIVEWRDATAVVQPVAEISPPVTIRWKYAVRCTE